MEMIDRYLQAVKFALPQAQRLVRRQRCQHSAATSSGEEPQPRVHIGLTVALFVNIYNVVKESARLIGRSLGRVLQGTVGG